MINDCVASRAAERLTDDLDAALEAIASGLRAPGCGDGVRSIVGRFVAPAAIEVTRIVILKMISVIRCRGGEEFGPSSRPRPARWPPHR